MSNPKAGGFSRVQNRDQQGVPQYAQRVCPLLSAPGMANQSAIARVDANGQQIPRQINVQPCLGPQCLWFQPIAQDGKIVDGDCSMNLLPISISLLTNTLVGIEKSRQAREDAASMPAPAAPAPTPAS